MNCLFDPFLCLETVSLMKAGLEEAGLSPHLMAQPLGYRWTRIQFLEAVRFCSGPLTRASTAGSHYRSILTVSHHN